MDLAGYAKVISRSLKPNPHVTEPLQRPNCTFPNRIRQIAQYAWGTAAAIEFKHSLPGGVRLLSPKAPISTYAGMNRIAEDLVEARQSGIFGQLFGFLMKVTMVVRCMPVSGCSFFEVWSQHYLADYLRDILIELLQTRNVGSRLPFSVSP